MSLVPLLLLLTLSLSVACNSADRGGKDASGGSDASANAGEKPEGEPVFQKTEHNFGELDGGEEVGARFGFENQGEGPLIIERVSTGCGCTVAEYSEGPIPPEESGFVEIIFDSRGKSGAQFQNARVYFEGLSKPVRLSVVAQVVKK